MRLTVPDLSLRIRSTMCYLSGDLFLTESVKASVVPAHLVSVVVVS